MTTYGAFIELEEGIDGMVHVSDMSLDPQGQPSVRSPRRRATRSMPIVLDVDTAQQRISLGMKQLAVDPWSDIDTFFKIGDVVQGTVTKIATFGAFVELQGRHRRPRAHLADQRRARREDQGRPQARHRRSTPASSRSTAMSAVSAFRSRRRTTPRTQLAAETSAYEALNRSAGNDMMNLGDILDEASKKE
jgi:small subunit ribosomal protein S1